MEDVAAARDARQGVVRAVAQATGEVGDGRLWREALLTQLQQAGAPGVAVAMASRLSR